MNQEPPNFLYGFQSNLIVEVVTVDPRAKAFLNEQLTQRNVGVRVVFPDRLLAAGLWHRPRAQRKPRDQRWQPSARG